MSKFKRRLTFELKCSCEIIKLTFQKKTSKAIFNPENISFEVYLRPIFEAQCLKRN